MKVFLTGANGFIGTALIPELIGAGHQVIGLSRSDEGAKKISSAGAEVRKGSLEDLDSLRSGAQAADGVIHCAYDQDLSNMEETGKKETQAIEALADGLSGTDRPLIITSVAAMGAAKPGQLATEDFFDPNTRNPRKTTEIAGAAAASRGVHVSTVRLSQVHSPVKMGLMSQLLRIAKEKGVSAYVGDGSVRWAAVHASDTARLFRLALERDTIGTRYNAVAEEGIALRDIAAAIGSGLNLPVKSLQPDEAASHFGWLGMFVGMDMSASSTQTKEQLQWEPAGPKLLKDLQDVLSAK